MNDLALDGDLNQMATQARFLRNSGFSLRRTGVYSIVGAEEVKMALEFIWNNNVAGWWHYLDNYLEHEICTEEEYNKKLWRNS